MAQAYVNLCRHIYETPSVREELRKRLIKDLFGEETSDEEKKVNRQMRKDEYTIEKERKYQQPNSPPTRITITKCQKCNEQVNKSIECALKIHQNLLKKSSSSKRNKRPITATNLSISKYLKK